MKPNEMYTVAQMVEAITATRGNILLASKRIGCDRVTFYRYAREYPEVSRALQSSREGVIDMVESKLVTQALAGNMTAIIFFLKTQAKDRGYVERTEHASDPDAPLTIKVVYDDDLDSDDTP